MLVKNVGTRPGDEMVQLYGRTLAPRRPMPLKQLAGFARVPLAPGEERRVSFSLSPIQAFAYYDEARKAMLVEPGEYEVQVGSSSLDVRVTGRVRVPSVRPRRQ